MPANDETLTAMEKQIDELTKKLEAAMKDGGAEKIAELQKALDEGKTALEAQKAEMAKLQGENELLKAKDKMSPKERAAMDEMMDDEDKKKFITMTPEERTKRMDEIAKGDESIKVAGVTIFKSKVGAEQFAVIKSQQDQIEKQAEDIRKEKDARQTVELTKRVETEMPHLPGETVAKVEVLKAVDAMPEAVRKTLETMLKAGNAAVKAAFNSLGSKGSNPELAKSAQGFEKTVTEIIKRDECSRTVALQKARQENPDGFKAYQEVGAQGN